MGSLIDLNDQEVEELIILSIATNPWAQIERPMLENGNTYGMHTDVYTSIVIRSKAEEYHQRQMGDITAAVLNSPSGKTALAMPSLKDDDRLQFLQVADYMYRQGYRLVTADEYRGDARKSLDHNGSTLLIPFWRPIRSPISMQQPIRLPVIQPHANPQSQQQQSQSHYHQSHHGQPSHHGHHHPSHYHHDNQHYHEANRPHPHHSHPTHHHQEPPSAAGAAGGSSHVMVPFTHQITSHPLTRMTIRPPPGIQHSFYGVGAFASAELLSLPTSLSLALATTQEGFYSPNGSPRRGGFTNPCPVPQGYIYNDPCTPLLYDPHGGFLQSQPPPQVNNQYPYDPYSYGNRYDDIATYGETKEAYDPHRQSHHPHHSQANHGDHHHAATAGGGGSDGNGKYGSGKYGGGSGGAHHSQGYGRGGGGGKINVHGDGDGKEEDEDEEGEMSDGEGVVMMMRKRMKPRGPSAVATEEQAAVEGINNGEDPNHHQAHLNNNDDSDEQDDDIDDRHYPHHTYTVSSTATTHPWPVATSYAHQHTTHHHPSLPYANHNHNGVSQHTGHSYE